MKFILEFDSEKKIKNLGIFNTKQEARAAMVTDLKEKGIKPYYYRSWKLDNVTECIDYGSHCSFYHIRMEE